MPNQLNEKDREMIRVLISGYYDFIMQYGSDDKVRELAVAIGQIANAALAENVRNSSVA